MEQAELQYLERTLTLLREQLSSLAERLEVSRERLKDSRADSYKERLQIIEDFADVIELYEIERDIGEQTHSYSRLYNAMTRIETQMKSPYFGRIDFASGGRTQPLYIGQYSLFDEHSLAAYVYDWRTPIASMFYDFEIGEAWYDAPVGRREGEITLKRQYKIVDGKMEYMFDCEVAVGDDLLGRALSESGGDTLKVIVSTIQREQNSAIRRNPQRPLLVLGPAGSGKSSVGMHRLAWLLYHDRERLKSNDLVVISLSEVFSAYIAGILPELGEQDVNRPLLDDLVAAHLPQNCNVEGGYYELARYVMSAGADEPRMREIELKLSDEFTRFIDKYFENFTFNFRDVVYRGNMICSADEQRSRVEGEPLTIDAAVRRLSEFIRSRCHSFFDARQGGIKRVISDKSEETLFADEVKERFKQVRFDFAEQSVERLLRSNRLHDDAALYRLLLTRFADGLAVPHLRHEDAMAILYIRAKLGKIAAQNSVKHALIDEAQDYHRLHLQFLKRLYPNASFTVLADPNQAIYAPMSTPTGDALAAQFVGADIAELGTGYRCTRQIYDYARSFIGQPPVEGFARDGEAVEVSERSAADIADILDRTDGGTVGIIAATALEAERIYNRLRDKRKVYLINRPDAYFQQGAAVMSSPFAKGLEFDTVVLVGRFDGRDGNLQYTMATRALHKLYHVL